MVNESSVKRAREIASDPSVHHFSYTAPKFRDSGGRDGTSTIDIRSNTNNRLDFHNAVDNFARELYMGQGGNYWGIHPNHAFVRFGPLMQTRVTPVKKTVTTTEERGWWIFKRKVPVTKEVTEKKIEKVPIEVDGEPWYAVGLVTRMEIMGLRGNAHVGQVIAMPKSKFDIFLAGVRKDPDIMEELYRKKHELASKSPEKFDRITVNETREDMIAAEREAEEQLTAEKEAMQALKNKRKK